MSKICVTEKLLTPNGKVAYNPPPGIRCRTFCSRCDKEWIGVTMLAIMQILLGYGYKCRDLLLFHGVVSDMYFNIHPLSAEYIEPAVGTTNRVVSK